MDEKEGIKEGERDFSVTVKLSGETLKQAMSIKSDIEKGTGRLMSIAAVVRSAIVFWYERGGVQ